MHPMLSLYRRILRLHHLTLPPVQRSLGDRYVKKEFRDHRTAKPEFVKGFALEWTKYADDLERRGAKIGRDLDETLMSNLSDEQKAMLARLKLETSRAREKE